jgi:hypothetical protein
MERGRNQVETSTATPKIVLLFEERCLDNKRSFRNDQDIRAGQEPFWKKVFRKAATGSSG